MLLCYYVILLFCLCTQIIACSSVVKSLIVFRTHARIIIFCAWNGDKITQNNRFYALVRIIRLCIFKNMYEIIFRQWPSGEIYSMSNFRQWPSGEIYSMSNFRQWPISKIYSMSNFCQWPISKIYSMSNLISHFAHRAFIALYVFYPTLPALLTPKIRCEKCGKCDVFFL